jgi:hypothetical protein
MVASSCLRFLLLQAVVFVLPVLLCWFCFLAGLDLCLVLPGAGILRSSRCLVLVF